MNGTTEERAKATVAEVARTAREMTGDDTIQGKLVNVREDGWVRFELRGKGQGSGGRAHRSDFRGALLLKEVLGIQEFKFTEDVRSAVIVRGAVPVEQPPPTEALTPR